MTPERHTRAKAIFLRACELAEPARSAHVAASCAGDAELSAAVTELLASDADPHVWLAEADEGRAAIRLAR